MASENQTIEALNLWCKIITRGLKETNVDLSPRQTALMLCVYLQDPPHSVKSLATHLDISKAAICRALDALCAEGFLKRKRDTEDKRNVLIQRTVKGSVYLSEMADIIRHETETEHSLLEG